MGSARRGSNPLAVEARFPLTEHAPCTSVGSSVVSKHLGTHSSSYRALPEIIAVATLRRTDITLHHRQKAEKVWLYLHGCCKQAGQDLAASLLKATLTGHMGSVCLPMLFARQLSGTTDSEHFPRCTSAGSNPTADSELLGKGWRGQEVGCSGI